MRPEPPPYFGDNDKLNKQFEAFTRATQEEQKSLIEGLDYPMMSKETRMKLISCSPQIFDPYKPPPNESKVVQAVKSPARAVVSVRDKIALRKMRKSMDDFDKEKFLELSHDIYLNLFREMSRVPMRIERLMQYCTEHCYPILLNGLEGMQLTWKYLETVEPSRIVKASVQPFIQDDHEFGQITVRKHSKQVLAIYDRFGRLVKGDPERPRSVLEYVVFERHMRPEDWGSEWRVHGKIQSAATPREEQEHTTTASSTQHNQQTHDDPALSSFTLKADFKTRIVPNMFVPKFDQWSAPSPPPDPNRWNEKWKDPGFYQLTEEQEEAIKRKKLRKKHMFDMHPTTRV